MLTAFCVEKNMTNNGFIQNLQTIKGFQISRQHTTNSILILIPILCKTVVRNCCLIPNSYFKSEK